MPSAEQIRAFSQSLQRLMHLYGRQAGLESASHDSLSKQDLTALSLLSLHGPRRMGDLAGDLGVVQSAITALVDRLEAQHLVLRRRSDEDRRAWLIDLTPEGTATATGYQAGMERFAAAMLAALDAPERATLVHLFARMEAAAV